MDMPSGQGSRKRRGSLKEHVGLKGRIKREELDNNQTAAPYDGDSFSTSDNGSDTAPGYQRPKWTPKPPPELNQDAIQSDQLLKPVNDERSSVSRGDSDTPYDTCFGVIIIQASIVECRDASLNTNQMTIHPSERGMLRILDSTRQVGAVYSPALCEFVALFRVHLWAFVETLEGRNRKFDKSISCYRTSVKIAVYGLDRQKRDVAYFLSSHDLFLQHPTADEYDSSVPYFNPQYLLGPSGSMPEIEGAAVTAAKQDMTESERAQVLRIFDTATNVSFDQDIVQSSRIESKLKDYQLSALAMMVERESGLLSGTKFPTIWELNRNYNGDLRYHHAVTGLESDELKPLPMSGGVIADEMGLGKTLPILALVARHADNVETAGLTANSLSTLVVAPKSTVAEWEQQIHRHVESGSISVLSYVGSNRERLSSGWDSTNIVLTTYDTLRSENRTNGPLTRKIWARVVLDEAHVIRNRSSQVFKAVSAIRANSRWCLTGTPIQNRLDDYGALMAFIGVPSFLDQGSFKRYIMHPLAKKQGAAFDTLRKLVKVTCLRRTKAFVESSIRLPRKSERTHVLELDENTKKLYQFFMRQASVLARGNLNNGHITTKVESRSNILTVIGILRLICNHGIDLLPVSALQHWRNKDTMSLDWCALSHALRTCASCGVEEAAISALGITLQEASCGHTICAECSDKAYRESNFTNEKHCPICTEEKSQSDHAKKHSLLTSSSGESVKITALLRNLRDEMQGSQFPDSKPKKSVVFTFWRKMLDLVQEALVANGFCVSRIDGQKSLNERRKALEAFQDDVECTVMLATIGSAGEGINLTAACAVHILEPQWNPMVEDQAIDRVHRLNQTRDVTVTRYLVKDSVETYVAWIQESKRQLISHSLSQEQLSDGVIYEQRWTKLIEMLQTTII